MRSLAHIMQQFHWTRATCGEVWPQKSTHGCKPGFRPPCGEVTLLLQDEHFAKNRKGLSLLLSELDLSQ